jgi:hypothetical protein
MVGNGRPHGDDLGNIVILEHVNVTVPDQSLATTFYISGLGGTRDPYLMVGLDNMWVNLGEQQFHLPTSNAQVIPGHVGLIVPDLENLKARLEEVEEPLAGTRYSWSESDGCMEVTGPWGNNFRCYEPAPEYGDNHLGVPYVEFLARPGTAEGIAAFYEQVLGAPSSVSGENGGKTAEIQVGKSQRLVFRETDDGAGEYDGHHIAIYVANISNSYSSLEEKGLITEEFDAHQYRFQEIVDPESGEKLHTLEHEVRSMFHPMYGRNLVNRDSGQNLMAYRKGQDAL